MVQPQGSRSAPVRVAMRYWWVLPALALESAGLLYLLHRLAGKWAVPLWLCSELVIAAAALKVLSSIITHDGKLVLPKMTKSRWSVLLQGTAIVVLAVVIWVIAIRG